MTNLPAGWERQPLGDLVDVLDYARVPVSAKERASRPGDIPYYGATGQTGWIDTPLFDEPLILLGEDGVQFFDPAKPKAYLISGPAWVNNHAHVLRHRHGVVDRRFLSHYLNQADYRGVANGTTRLKLTQAAMKRMPIVLPGLEEQRRIVDILEDHLSRLDAADSYVEASILRSGTLIRSSILTNPLVRAAPLSTLQHLLAQPLTNGRSVPTRAGGFPVLRLTALTAQGVDLAQRKPGAWSAHDAQAYLVHHGDFLVSRGNGSLKLVARGALVREEPDEVAYPDTLIRVRADPSLIDSEYLSTIWNSPLVRRQIEAAARTTAGIYKINQKQLAGISVPLPTIDEQRQVVASTGAASDAVQLLSREIAIARARGRSLRRALLAAAFSGRLTGRSTDTEVVEELAAAERPS